MVKRRRRKITPSLPSSRISGALSLSVRGGVSLQKNDLRSSCLHQHLLHHSVETDMGDVVPEIIQTRTIMLFQLPLPQKIYCTFKNTIPLFFYFSSELMIENGPVLDLGICRDLPETQLRASPLLLQTGKSLRIGPGNGLASG